MRIVIRLENDMGKVLKEIKSEAPNEQAHRVAAWWREYFGDPQVQLPAEEGKPAESKPVSDEGLFELWAQQVLNRLRIGVKEHEARQPHPDKNAKLLD